MARRSRVSRVRSETANATVVPSPFVRRAVPHFNPLDEEQIVRLERQVDWIIENVGFAFRDDPEAIRIWEEAGVTLSDGLVKADATWVRQLCAKAPR